MVGLSLVGLEIFVRLVVLVVVVLLFSEDDVDDSLESSIMDC